MLWGGSIEEPETLLPLEPLGRDGAKASQGDGCLTPPDDTAAIRGVARGIVAHGQSGGTWGPRLTWESGL